MIIYIALNLNSWSFKWFLQLQNQKPLILNERILGGDPTIEQRLFADVGYSDQKYNK